MRRIGYIYPGRHTAHQPSAAAFLDGLRKLGWIEGQNLVIEWRFGEGRNELVPYMAAELARLPVELIFSAAAGPLVIQPETSEVPIVEPFMSDPHAYGIQNLARPGGNVTGLSNNGAALYIKSVELLKMILPNLARVAVMADPSSEQFATWMATGAQTAGALGIQVLDVDVRRVEDVEAALATARTRNAEAVLLINQPSFTTGVYARVAELAAPNRLPAMFGFPSAVTENGGLMAFGEDLLARYRQGAEYVDKILRGARPADLPVEEPREFDFIVNVETAQVLGITFPPDAAAQVTQWVQ
jgi:putative tryptophan/tyrosine transport system substrate-binding protein